MSRETHDFRPRLRMGKVGLLIVAGSLLVHAAVILASFLAPKSPPAPSARAAACLEPIPPAPGEPTAPAGTGLAGGAGTGSAGGSRILRPGSSFALGPEVAAPADAEILWPCCGPGCPSELAIP